MKQNLGGQMTEQELMMLREQMDAQEQPNAVLRAAQALQNIQQRAGSAVSPAEMAIANLPQLKRSMGASMTDAEMSALTRALSGIKQEN